MPTIKQVLKGSVMEEVITIAERIAKIGQLPDSDASKQSFCLERFNMGKALNQLHDEVAERVISHEHP